MFPWRKLNMVTGVCQLNASFQACADNYPEHESNEGRSGENNPWNPDPSQTVRWG
jgi:hypothetical protein